MAKIILLDDHDLSLVAMQAALEMAGHKVLTGGSGRGIAKRVQMENPDILITDLYMPDEDGLGVINEIRRFDKKLPIIAVSGMGGKNAHYLNSAKLLGANATLIKPFNQGELLSLVNILLDGQGATGVSQS